MERHRSQMERSDRKRRSRSPRSLHRRSHSSLPMRRRRSSSRDRRHHTRRITPSRNRELHTSRNRELVPAISRPRHGSPRDTPVQQGNIVIDTAVGRITIRRGQEELIISGSSRPRSQEPSGSRDLGLEERTRERVRASNRNDSDRSTVRRDISSDRLRRDDRYNREEHRTSARNENFRHFAPRNVVPLPRPPIPPIGYRGMLPVAPPPAMPFMRPLPPGHFRGWFPGPGPRPLPPPRNPGFIRHLRPGFHPGVHWR